MKLNISNVLLQTYKHDGIEETYNQARALVYIISFVNILLVGLVFLVSNLPLRIYLSLLFFINLALLNVIQRGHYYAAGMVEVTFLSLLISFFTVQSEHQYYYEIYQLVALQLFLMVFTLLITSRRIHVLIPMVIGTFTTFYIYLFRALPLQLTGENPSIDNYVLGALILILSAITVMGTNQRGRRLLTKVEDELEINRLKALKMQELIKGLSNDFDTGEKLIDSSGQVSSFVDEIHKMIESVRDEMNLLSVSVIKLNQASESIKESSSSASNAVDEQSAIIEESSSAVTEMAVSIENISKIANERKKVVQSLSEGSKEAGEAIISASESMKTLNKLISSMEEISNVISGISDQTSLLAMNAAIEAAHAGDAGKGFAVVADEVRKLSENSAENVQIISRQLNELSDSISIANELNLTASDAYENISRDISDVVGGMDEIIYSVNELSAGTSEINMGTSQSVNSTSEVRESVLIVNERILEISETILGLERSSHTVLASVEETIGKLNLVQSVAETLKSIGNLNAENLKNLGEKISSI